MLPVVLGKRAASPRLSEQAGKSRFRFRQALYNTLCAGAAVRYIFAMANEIAIVDGEDLRKRAGALRRFL